MRATNVKPIDLAPPAWGYSVGADDAGRPRQFALGPTIGDLSADLPRWLYPALYPTWGDGDAVHRAPLMITHADGRLSTRLVLDDTSDSEDAEGVTRTLHCRDEELPLTVDLVARAHHGFDILEQWVEIRHEESDAITLHDYASLHLSMTVAADAGVIHFGGAGWADEWAWVPERLTAGLKVLESLGGVQPHLQRCPMLLVEPNGPATETAGDTVAFSIAWGGNTRFELDVRPLPGHALRSLRLTAGANGHGAPYRLDPGTTFRTPGVLWTWSSHGRGPATDRFHRYTRRHALRDGERTRSIVANNWEATYFDFDTERLGGLIQRAADIGAETFLLDDGWFGSAHPRNDDDAGLGDWTVNTDKLPGGMAPVAQAAVDAGLRFGIWVEPEMVNPRSECFERHPEWIVRDARPPLEHRNQFLLDVLRPDVAAFVDAAVAAAIEAAPDTTYVKWDANRPMTDPGSTTLGVDRQANVWVDQVRATWDRMAAAAATHPEVEMMLCASGGGRVDHGSLRWFHEFWTSDNTDPVDRLAMQWACSHFFPAVAMAAHATTSGDRPLEFALGVALWGRFGFDLDLDSLSDADLERCRCASVIARRTRELVQHGRLERLVSPVDRTTAGRQAAVAYVNDDGSRAVVLAYQITAPERDDVTELALRGLRPNTTYELRQLRLDDPTVSDIPGAGPVESRHTANAPLPWPGRAAFTSTILELTAEEAGA